MVQWANTMLRNLDVEIERDLDKRAENIRNEAWTIEAGALKRRTGLYNRSFFIRKKRMQRDIGNRAPYAWFLERGTKAHKIEAKNKKTLRFIAGGRQVFPRSVQHPGTRPYRVLQTALKRKYRS